MLHETELNSVDIATDSEKRGPRLKLPDVRCPPMHEILLYIFPSPIEGLALLQRVKLQLEEERRTLRKQLRPALTLIHKEENTIARLLMRATVGMSETGMRMRQIAERLRALSRTERQAKRLYGVSDKEIKGGLADGQIQAAREVPVLDVVSACIEVRKMGRSYAARCPFHDDAAPSLYIYPEQNRYHCYGCGKNGDVIDFVMSYFKCSFKKAVIYLQGGKRGEQRPTGR